MTRAEREAFLADLHVGVISIERPGGAPLAVPIWYDYDPAIGVWVLTGKRSEKGRALEAAGRFALCAQNDTAPNYSYVSVEGPIVSVRPADRERDSRPMARRYFGEQLGDRYIAATEGEISHVYTMRPERWRTVDYAKTGRTG
jgi:nitroimidazol reductase NimA-like FMN-containing flavoprotein (pyridoxamine 5'-phosphate oxidase superfamily)